MGRRCTTIKLEKPFWETLERIAGENDVGLSEMIMEIDRSTRSREDQLVGYRNLASCLRIFCLLQSSDNKNSCETYLKEMT